MIEDSNISKPIRTCIACKKKFLQRELLRFTIKEKEIIEFNGSGRSLYFCATCKKNSKEKIVKILNGKFKVDTKSIKMILD